MASKRGADGVEDQGLKKARTEGEEERQEVRVLIDNYEASVIIGKQGANVKDIRAKSSAFVSILKNEGSGVKERVMQVTGSIESVCTALRMIAELLIRNDNERKSSEEQREVTEKWTLKLLIHKQLAGAIIGKGGEIIRGMQAESGAKISLSTDSVGGSTEKTATCSGTAAELHDVVTRIITRIVENPIRQGTQSVLYVPGQQPPIAYGAPGPYGAPSPYGMAPSPYGMPQQGYAPMGAPMQGVGGGVQKTQKIVIPTVCAGTVIGKGGSIIRDIKAQSATTISVAAPDPPTSEDRVVTIAGSEQGIQTAIYLIRQRVESFTAAPGPAAQQY